MLGKTYTGVFYGTRHKQQTWCDTNTRTFYIHIPHSQSQVYLLHILYGTANINTSVPVGNT